MSSIIQLNSKYFFYLLNGQFEASMFANRSTQKPNMTMLDIVEIHKDLIRCIISFLINRTQTVVYEMSSI